MQTYCFVSLFVPLFFGDGPVTVGMSLDIASIDTISEINMVRIKKLLKKIKEYPQYWMFYLFDNVLSKGTLCF